MARTTLAQFSFNRGEVEPALHSRSDWKYYFSAAASMKNLIAKAQGGAAKRPGMRFIDYALSQEKPSFFIPFTFSTEQAYLLEFGDFQMRILMDGALVRYPEGHSQQDQIVVIPTPYSSDDLPLLRHAQTADIMYITISSHRPRILKRYDHHDWRFDNIDFGQTVTPPDGLRWTKDGRNGASYCVTAMASATEESAASDVVTVSTASGVGIQAPDTSAMNYDSCYSYITGYLQEAVPANRNFYAQTTINAFNTFCMNQGVAHVVSTNIVNGDTQYLIEYYGAGSFWTDYDDKADLLGQYRSMVIQFINQGYWGVLADLRALIDQRVAAINDNATPNGFTKLAWNPVPGAVEYKVFRSVATDDGTVFHLVGTVAGTTFDDDNLPYDSSKGLPATVNLFDGPGDYPGACAFFEQRMVFARTDNQPNTFWGSVTGDYNTFTRHTPIVETDYYEFTLDSGEMNAINWIIPLNELLFGTSGNEWKAGGGSAALSPLNVNARPQSWYGCAEMNPVAIGKTVVFVAKGGRNVRTFSYSLEADGYAGKDITAYAGHLFEGKRIVSLVHQKTRDSILWAVQSDGGLLSATFDPDEDIIAWTRHETMGKVESCGVQTDENGMDKAYFCVARTIGGETVRFIEVLAEPPGYATAVEDMVFLDSSLSVEFPEPSPSASNLDHLEGETVMALADGNVIKNLVVSGGRVEFPDGAAFSRIHVGLPYEAELRTMELEPPEGGTLSGRPRWVAGATMRFLRTRECLASNAASKKTTEIKFRTEGFDEPIQPYTGEKHTLFPIPGNARSTSIRLISGDPVPFTILGVIAEAGYGQTS